jgi:hypothetical protein
MNVTWFHYSVLSGLALVWPFVASRLVGAMRDKGRDVGGWTPRRVLVRGVVATLVIAMVTLLLLLTVFVLSGMGMMGI